MIYIIDYPFDLQDLYTIILRKMKSKRIVKSLGFILIGSLISITTLKATENDKSETNNSVKVAGNSLIGKQYFEGSKRFLNAGPACISCHNVSHEKMIPGGILAKDLTDVYSRMGDGLSGWLSAPSFPAMVSSYQAHPLTDNERTHLTAFLKEVNETGKISQDNAGQTLMIFGGIGGLFIMFLLVGLIWMKRKRQMVKREIFERQIRAWDAKH
jgi:hypothetical protein